ncbi:MAG TPA: hypothetical protein VMH37_05530 [Candidatus Binataceae bacterium]|nr:hypothetical protein [Candidatus Binataceae bacterium]
MRTSRQLAGSCCPAFLLALCVLVFPAGLSRAAETQSDPAGTLQKLAEGKFGQLSRAELLLVRGAAQRNLVWLGPSIDPSSPDNDLAHADTWGPERTVRAALIRWIASDSDAGRFVDPSGPGFAGAKIKGQIDFSYLMLPKPITILHSYVPDGIDFSNARTQAIDLRRSRTGPIDGDSATVDGDLSMLLGSYGSVSLFRARVTGNLDFVGAHVSNPGADAIVATEATIGGDADFHQGFTTNGLIDFRFAKVGHSLSFNDARFTGDGDNGLNAERAVIDGMIYWVNIAHTPHTILDLANARAQGLGDDTASWPASGNLNLDGFVYGSIVDGPTDAAARLRWLALQPSGYKPQPYEQLAKVLTADGNDSGATDVLIAQREAQRLSGNLGRLERLWNLVLQVTIGYGFRPLRALWWIFGFVMFGTLLFSAGYRMKVITPTEADAYDGFSKTGYAPPHYPPFNAFVYSLENFLPVVELHQGEYWRPNPRHMASTAVPASLLRWYLWLHILAGWTLTPLLFAGLSGLIRPG